MAALCLSGCAVQHRALAPIEPAASAATLGARRLDDPALLTFLRANHALPTPAWSLPALADAALFFSPALQQARAQLALEQAGEITAAARPNPTFDIQPGVPSPYLLSLDWALPIVTHGKRGWQMRQASALTSASRMALAQTAWQVRAAVRAALLQVWAAAGEQRQLQAQLQVQSARVRLLNAQLAAGEIARPELDTARIALTSTQQALAHAATRALTAQAALAGAVGVPVTALDGLHYVWPDWDTPPPPGTIPATQMRRAAIVNRLDVRAALAQYQAAEAGLQLELARQYPDLQLGPGYSYEESRSYFTVGLSVALPIFNRNQGPIAETEARRQAAAAAVTAAQADVMAASDAAWAAYRGAYAEWQTARSLLELQQTQLAQARSALAAGETESLALNSAQLQAALDSTTVASALVQVQTALGNLEDAVQRPLGAGEATSLLQPETLESIP